MTEPDFAAVVDDTLALVSDTNLASIADAVVHILHRFDAEADVHLCIVDDTMAWTQVGDDASAPMPTLMATDDHEAASFDVDDNGVGEWVVHHQGMSVGCVRVQHTPSVDLPSLRCHLLHIWGHLGAALSNASLYKTLENVVEAEMQTSVERELRMQLVLDNMNDALVMIDLDGNLDGVRSAKLEEWLGRPEEGQAISTYLFGDDEDAAGQFRVGVEEMLADIMPFELTSHQAVRHFVRDERHFSVSYDQVHKDDAVVGLVLTIRDVTVEVANREAELERREMMGTLHHLLRDRSLFFAFIDTTTVELERLVEVAASEDALRHALHTLKGNTALMGFVRLPQALHDVETRLEQGEEPQAAWFDELLDIWHKSLTPFAQLRDGDIEEYVRVRITELEQVLDDDDLSLDELRLAMRRWQWPEASVVLSGLGSSAERIARSQGKSVKLRVDGGGTRIPPEYDAVFREAVHLVRNAVDHGIELPHERRAQDKEAEGRITLTAVETDAGTLLSVVDDGRGVDWGAIAAKAKAMGLPYDNQADLDAAFFADQLSTRDNVTTLSGRGVGTSAIALAVAAAGGRITVKSALHKGTTVEVYLPRPEASAHPTSLR